MAKVIMKAVDKIYEGNVQAVYNFNLEIPDKAFCVFVGPSGCGKSTTLRMVAGLEEITRGEMYIGDTLINDIPPKDRDIAMVFQNYALYPHMTVYENMAFGLRIRKYDKVEIDARVREAAEILNIDKLLDRTPAALSGGQRQRVAMGRAIVRKPKVFLFDEPLSNLDAKLRVTMRSEISKLHTRLQTTMIYVTHDQVEAMTMGDIIVVMKDGVIQQVDNPIQLYNHPKNQFVASFIGTPPMNFFRVKIKKEGKDVYVEDGSIRIKLFSNLASKLLEINYQKEEIVLGIRPEDVYMMEDYTEKVDDNTIDSVVEVVEPLGSHSYLFLNSGTSSFQARGTNAIDHHSVGKKMKFALDLNRAKLFDIDSEKTIVDLDY